MAGFLTPKLVAFVAIYALFVSYTIGEMSGEAREKFFGSIRNLWTNGRENIGNELYRFFIGVGPITYTTDLIDRVLSGKAPTGSIMALVIVSKLVFSRKKNRRLTKAAATAGDAPEASAAPAPTKTVAAPTKTVAVPTKTVAAPRKKAAKR